MHICQPANLPGTSVLEIGWKRQASLAIRPSWRDCIGGTEWELIGPSCLLSYFFSLTRIPGGNGQAVSRLTKFPGQVNFVIRRGNRGLDLT